MRNMIILALNTLKVTFHKKVNIIFYLILPVAIVLLILNFGTGNGSGKVNIGICNNDKDGKIASDFVSSIKKQPRYKVTSVKSENIKSMLTDQKVDCVVTIPENFDDEILNSKFDKMIITSIKGRDATGWVQNYIDYYVRNLIDISKAADGDKEVFDNIYKNGNYLKVSVNTLKDKSKGEAMSQTGIGLITMFMLFGASTISGFTLKEKKERTYFRIFASPVNSRIYIGGNIIAGMFIMIAQSALLVFSLTNILNVDIQMPVLELFLMLIIFGLVSVSVGTLIVAFSNSSYQSSTLTTLITVPSCMLSGCFWPISVMPTVMQNAAYFLPQAWLIEGIKRVQNTGSLKSTLPCIGILMCFAIVFFLISIFKMKSNNNVNNFI